MGDHRRGRGVRVCAFNGWCPFHPASRFLPAGTRVVASAAAGNGRFVLTTDGSPFSHRISRSRVGPVRICRGAVCISPLVVSTSGLIPRCHPPIGMPRTDGANWAVCSGYPGQGIIVIADRLVAVGTSKLTTSIDGLDWTVDSTRPGIPSGLQLLPGDNGFLAFKPGSLSQLWGDGGHSSFSPNGIDWPPMGSSSSFYGPVITHIDAFGGRRFLREKQRNVPTSTRVRYSSDYGEWNDLRVDDATVCAFAVGSESVCVLTSGRDVWKSDSSGGWVSAIRRARVGRPL